MNELKSLQASTPLPVISSVPLAPVCNIGENINFLTLMPVKRHKRNCKNVLDLHIELHKFAWAYSKMSFWTKARNSSPSLKCSTYLFLPLGGKFACWVERWAHCLSEFTCIRYLDITFTRKTLFTYLCCGGTVWDRSSCRCRERDSISGILPYRCSRQNSTDRDLKTAPIGIWKQHR